jgi:hypothetical protein
VVTPFGSADILFMMPHDGKENLANANLVDDARLNAAKAIVAERLLKALHWYVENDDVIVGQEGNEFWVKGFNEAQAALTAWREINES